MVALQASIITSVYMSWTAAAMSSLKYSGLSTHRPGTYSLCDIFSFASAGW